MSRSRIRRENSVVTAEVPVSRVHTVTVNSPEKPSVGGRAVVVFAYPVATYHVPLFMVECIDATGAWRWLADIYLAEMEVVGHQRRPVGRAPARQLQPGPRHGEVGRQ
jgi:hypothetical protein